MTFNIFYDKQAEKFLEKLQKPEAKRIVEKIDYLSPNPIPQGVVTIVGEHEVFRLRVSNYRILYRVKYQERKIIIFKIGKRKSTHNQ